MKSHAAACALVVGCASAVAGGACTITTDLTGLSGGGSAGDGGPPDGASGGSSGGEGGTSSGVEAGADSGDGPRPGCVDKSVTKRGASASSAPGGFGNAWMPAEGALTADDGSIAQVQTAAFFGAGPLTVKKYGFAIAPSAYVRGVRVSVKKRGEQGVRDDTVRLVISGTAPSGDDKKLAAAWRETFEVTDYGGATDRWGLALTPAIVDSDAFGVVFNVRYDDAGNASAEVDEIAVTVTYCE